MVEDALTEQQHTIVKHVLVIIWDGLSDSNYNCSGQEKAF